MTPRKLKIGIARFPYAGNGGCQAENPAVGDFVAETVVAISRDNRCEWPIGKFTKADTPIPMVRNESARWALAKGIDILLMVDSDMTPDVHLDSELHAKPFWASSFDFMYKRWEKGPCIVAAPYCGVDQTPEIMAEDNPFIYYWKRTSNDRNHSRISVEGFSRNEAASRIGFEEVAAIGTGLILIDTRIFKDPRLPKPWFAYEWKDEYQSEKASTEDIYFTRNASMTDCPIFVNWDAWAGHNKPVTVGKPLMVSVEDVQKDLGKCLSDKFSRYQAQMEVNPGKNLEDILGFTPKAIIDDRDEQRALREHDAEVVRKAMDKRFVALKEKPNGSGKRSRRKNVIPG